MDTFLAIFTYFSYCFIVVAYTVKIVKYLKLPIHLRWELYPVIHEGAYQYGGSCFETINWWERSVRRRPVKGFFTLLKGYFTMDEYFKRDFFYWSGLFTWHMGFIFIITFHILCFIGAFFMTQGIEVSISSSSSFGKSIFYLTLTIGLLSFVLGTAGSIMVFINRLINKDLKKYATSINYFMYFFTFSVFLTGIYSWYFDMHFTEYREFWKGLIQFDFKHVDQPTVIHIIIFNLFLIFLPFTRSLHYITRFFAYYLIRWDDEPNIRGGEIEKRIVKQLSNKVDWAGPHITKGRSWREQ